MCTIWIYWLFLHGCTCTASLTRLMNLMALQLRYIFAKMEHNAPTNQPVSCEICVCSVLGTMRATCVRRQRGAAQVSKRISRCVSVTVLCAHPITQPNDRDIYSQLTNRAETLCRYPTEVYDTNSVVSLNGQLRKSRAFLSSVCVSVCLLAQACVHSVHSKWSVESTYYTTAKHLCTSVCVCVCLRPAHHREIRTWHQCECTTKGTQPCTHVSRLF